MNNKKLIIGWFSFTCSEDSTILLTELLNEHFKEWKKVIEFRHFKLLKSNNRLEGLDVAFVEGAISSKTQAEALKKIRDNCKYLVAIGACACSGQPSAFRNTLIPEDLNFKTEWYMNRFDYSKNVQKIADFIKVDDQVPGCPMDTKTFLDTVGKYLKLCHIVN